MPVATLKEFLDAHHVKYISMMHSPAFTAQEIAATAHVSGRQLAKTVVVKYDNQFALAVLAATDHINFSALQHSLSTSAVELAAEHEFKDKFPGCELGAMPPFGNLFDMPVLLSSKLSQQDHILFNAGTHSELIEMSFQDYERLVKPKVIAF